MKNVKSQDERLLNKSKHHLTIRLVLTFLFLLVYGAGVYYLIRHQYINIDNGGFITLWIGLMISQTILYAIIFFMLISGTKIFRMLYWVAFVFSASLIYIPALQILDDTGHVLSYLVIMVCMLVKIYILLHTGLYLHKSPAAKAIFDSVIQVDEEAGLPSVPMDPGNPKPSHLPNAATGQSEESMLPPTPKKVTTYTNLASRLGVCVYVSLGVFPVLVQLGHSIFTSIDYHHIFANRDMFISCLVSAMIWTLPVFYLYYNHPRSRRMVRFCIAAEVIRCMAYAPFFIGYMHTTEIEYPARAFIGFLLLDGIRYFLLWQSIQPIFKMDIPNEEIEDVTDF